MGIVFVLSPFFSLMDFFMVAVGRTPVDDISFCFSSSPATEVLFLSSIPASSNLSPSLPSFLFPGSVPPLLFHLRKYKVTTKTDRPQRRSRPRHPEQERSLPSIFLTPISHAEEF